MIRAAARRIRPFIHETPVLTSATIDARCGAEVFFKCENLQKIGAFKARGAHNAVFLLSDREAANGVVTHSSGNHAAALSLAARNRGIPAYVVMPSNAAKPKIESVRRLGGKITFCEPTLAAREATAAAVMKRTGAVLIHPFNDVRIIAGQGTAALELMRAVPRLDAIVAPVGGGGLLAGTAIAVKGMQPRTRVYAAEPKGADDAARSFKAGRLIPLGKAATLADGLRTSLGPLTFPVVRDRVDGVVTVSERAIVDAMRLVWEVLKIVIEPSAAVAVAAVLQRGFPLKGKRVGVILSGGNVDLDQLPWM
jgi:threonine dehydratase